MKAPLLEEVLKYHDEKNLPLSMPGNKGGKGFDIDKLGRKFADKMGHIDITEVDPLDNLQCPEGVIKEAQDLLAKTYKCRKAYFMVNGSSGGNMASIFAAFDEGDEVIVERNCHKSIYNAIILKKLKVTYIKPVIDDENGIFLPPDKKNIYEAVNKCKKPKGIILTYPNYFGITYEIEDIISDLKKRKMKVIIDSAHGAHFGFDNRLPKSLASLGDYVVISAHKTLPALTQGSYLLINEENELLEFYLRAFMTTSPSYLIMSSLDYARYYLDEYGEKDYKALIDRAEKWKLKINSLEKIKIISKDDILISKNDEHIDRFKYDLDLSRYVIIVPKGYSGHKLLEYLRKEKIQAEMSFSRGIVLILSPFNDDNDFEKIYLSILNLNMKDISSEVESQYSSITPTKILEPYQAFKLKGEIIDIEDSEGLVAKKSIIPYPPGVPLVCSGEVISRECIEIIEEYIINKKDILGLEENNKIAVIRV